MSSQSPVIAIHHFHIPNDSRWKAVVRKSCSGHSPRSDVADAHAAPAFTAACEKQAFLHRRIGPLQSPSRPNVRAGVMIGQPWTLI